MDYFPPTFKVVAGVGSFLQVDAKKSRRLILSDPLPRQCPIVFIETPASLGHFRDGAHTAFPEPVELALESVNFSNVTDDVRLLSESFGPCRSGPSV
jgi:hypothetical protein